MKRSDFCVCPSPWVNGRYGIRERTDPARGKNNGLDSGLEPGVDALTNIIAGIYVAINTWGNQDTYQTTSNSKIKPIIVLEIKFLVNNNIYVNSHDTSI